MVLYNKLQVAPQMSLLIFKKDNISTDGTVKENMTRTC